MLRTFVIAFASLAAVGTLHAGALDLELGAQATTTAWATDHGGGATLSAGWWFLPWLGASFVGKEQYATVDDRFLSYFSVNASGRVALPALHGLRVTGTLGLVHQHEEPRAAVMAQPWQSVFGVGDGIRHRAGERLGVALALPVRAHGHGDYYVALELDATAFTDNDRGPRWMASAGVAAGFTYDFAARPK